MSNKHQLEVLGFSDGEISLVRPCVECGLLTGSFCDGGIQMHHEQCFAIWRVPSERWNFGQRTPLCTGCDKHPGFCRFCRGVHGCTPPTKFGWLRSIETPNLQSWLPFIARPRFRYLLSRYCSIIGEIWSSLCHVSLRRVQSSLRL